MRTLSGAPDHVVSWSDFSLQNKNVRKLTGFVVQFFRAFTGFVILVTCWSSADAGPLWLLSYKEQSLAYSNMCYLLWSHVEFRIVFFLTVRGKIDWVNGLTIDTATQLRHLTGALQGINTERLAQQ